jgi:hypothetical protein
VRFELSRMLDLLAARYIVTASGELPAPYERIDQVGDMTIWRNPNAMPRAFIVHRALPVLGEDAAVGLLESEDFDYAETVLLHDSDRRPLRDGAGRMDAGESARVAADSGDTVVVEAELTRPGYLVLADQWYPGWQAAVDGKPVPLLRLDHLLKGVRLEPGAHRVEFVFRPAAVRVGLTVGAAAAAILVLGVIAAMYEARRRGKVPGNESRLYVGYEARTARKVAVVAVLFLVLGPALRPGPWRMFRFQIDPRHYVASRALTDSVARKAAGDLEGSYRAVFERALWWPDNARLRVVSVLRADELVRSLLAEERDEDARRIAREAAGAFPAEARAIAPALFVVANPD